MSTSLVVKLLVLTVVIFCAAYFLLFSSTVALDTTQQASVISSLLLLSYLILSISQDRLKISQALRYSLGWIVIFTLLFIGYSFRNEAADVYTRLKLNLIPSVAMNNGDGSITLLRQQDGHFYVKASVNGQPLLFMIDTGATRTTLTTADAARLGLNLEKLKYNQPANTANGIVYSAAIELTEIMISTIVVKNVKASVNKDMKGVSLLGMSFLEQLKEFKIERDQLTLKK